MNETMELEVLTPESQALSAQVTSVTLQGSEGQLGILPQHTALISKLAVGVLSYQSNGAHELLCGSGLVEIHGNRVTVLVRSAETKEQIDVERAKESLSRAKSRRDSGDKDIDMARAEAAQTRAQHRLRFVGALKH